MKILVVLEEMRILGVLGYVRIFVLREVLKLGATGKVKIFFPREVPKLVVVKVLLVSENS